MYQDEVGWNVKGVYMKSFLELIESTIKQIKGITSRSINHQDTS